MRAKSGNKRSINSIIKDKMRCLDDFGICSADDKDMIAELQKAIEDNPNKDPQVVADMHCRGMIKQKIMSWA